MATDICVCSCRWGWGWCWCWRSYRARKFANIFDEIKYIREKFSSLSLDSILSIACFGLNDMFNKDRTSPYFNLEENGWILLSRVEEDEYESVFSTKSEILGIRWRN